MSGVSFVSIESDIKDAQKMLKGLDYNKASITRKILTGVGTGAKQKVKRNYNSLLNKKSGALYKSVARKVNKKGTAVTISANASVRDKNGKAVRYGYVLAAGTTIKPKDPDGYLTFSINDKWVRVKSVTIKERDYLKPPVDRYLGSPEYNQKVETILNNEIKKIEEKVSKR